MIDETWNGMSKYPVEFLTKIESNDSELGFFFAEVIRNEGNVIDVHHNALTIICLKNKAVKKIGSKIFIEEGVFLRKPGETTNFEILSPTHLQILMISNAYVETVLKQKMSLYDYSKINSQLDLYNQQLIISLMDSLGYISRGNIKKTKIIDNIIQAILNVFINEDEKYHDLKKSDRIFWKKVYNYVENENLQSIKVTDLAILVQMSERHFSRKFMLEHGVSPYQYIIAAKIKKSIKYLMIGHFALSEIAFLSGFNDQSQFSTLFKKKMGVTPLEYREKYMSHNI